MKQLTCLHCTTKAVVPDDCSLQVCPYCGGPVMVDNLTPTFWGQIQEGMANVDWTEVAKASVIVACSAIAGHFSSKLAERLIGNKTVSSVTGMWVTNVTQAVTRTIVYQEQERVSVTRPDMYIHDK